VTPAAGALAFTGHSPLPVLPSGQAAMIVVMA